jgi:CheY-like chemotaxis protein
VILVDFVLADVDGTNLCKQLKDDTQTKDIPVVLITGKEIMKDRGVINAELEQSGADDFLAKPFEVPQLLEKIDKLTSR